MDPQWNDVFSVEDTSKKWRRIAARFDWSGLRCGCDQGARHVPSSFAALVAAQTEEEADGAGLRNHIEVQSMLFESAVPVVSMILAALDEELLTDAARWGLLYLLMVLVLGESEHVEVLSGRPDLELECRDAARDGIPLLYEELRKERVRGRAEYAICILEALGEDRDELIAIRRDI
ncbi:hypothetical protein AB0M79_17450 [Polymorphospora sp. NPDC051019]|uniref:hypothetical protein n=1 Tax=Polymorphospora sp. NPDC051019 TaxID=3155725 RepID=UPI00341721D1